ncbi:MAG: hypothetical protein H5T62_02995 [Anaerolineae bacterium]|nr:hypothetical protein [Anaerolineae bacterium]
MMKSQEIVPLVLSIVVIILVAVLEKHSKLVAAITATMPLTAPLALWIVYSSVGGERAAVTEFSLGLLLGIMPTVAFLAAVWLASRAGLKLGAMILVGYSAWGIVLALIALVRKVLGGLG